jgi:hypothetical protein
MRWFGAADNQLDGSLTSFSVAQAYYIYLSNNKLSGDMPASACKSMYLSELDLSYNKLSGEGAPSCCARLLRALGPGCRHSALLGSPCLQQPSSLAAVNLA